MYENGHPSKSTLPQHLKQYPLIFASIEADRIAKHLTSFGNSYPQRIVYMGPRYTNSVQAIKTYGKVQHFNSDRPNEDQLCKQAEVYGSQMFSKYLITAQFQKQKGAPVRAQEYRLFKGMNPTANKNQLHFNSDLECGNLDLAVKVSQNEYDLFMRVDTNTRGHSCWFFFKVFQIKQARTVKFNIYNFSKKDLMYDSGLKISVYSSKKKDWSQEGENIVFRKPLRTGYYDDQQRQCLIVKKQSFCLSFEYTFSPAEEYLYFASCKPYSYSYLLHRISELRWKHIDTVELDTSHTSTGGLTIPILTITNRNQLHGVSPSYYKNHNQKPTCLIIGRLHPGQTHSSWLLEGFLKFLCSPAADYLRDQILFKIIPMVNVDGVVLGNFRTGIIGRDLNRMFRDPELSREVAIVRNLASQLKPFLFLDFHGHCSKKYIFTYGPDYNIDHRYFLQSRLLPKLIEKNTKSFRYYACSFRINPSKSTTARAIMLKRHQVIFTYTIETSIYAYGFKNSETVFTHKQLLMAGQKLGSGVSDFVKIAFTLPKRMQIKQQKKQKQGKEKNIFERLLKNDNSHQLTPQAKDILAEIMDDEKEIARFQQQHQQKESDFQEGEDYSDQELALLFHQRKDPENKLKKPYKQRRNSNRPAKITKTQKSIVDSSEQKIEKRSELKRNHQVSRPLKVRIYKQMPCITPFLNRNALGRSKYSSIFVSHDDMEANKINYKHSSSLIQEGASSITKNESQDGVILSKPASIMFSPIHIHNCYQPFSEAKNKDKEKNTPERQLRRQTKKKLTIEPRLEVKKTVLPLLGRAGIMNAHEAKSMVQEIIQKQERLKANKTRRQLKIMPI